MLLLDDGGVSEFGPATLQDSDGIGWAQALAQLTGLVDLSFGAPVRLGKLTRSRKRDMLQLTQLQALTRLEMYDKSPKHPRACVSFGPEASDGECDGSEEDARPVWQQLQSYLMQGTTTVLA